MSFLSKSLQWPLNAYKCKCISMAFYDLYSLVPSLKYCLLSHHDIIFHHCSHSEPVKICKQVMQAHAPVPYYICNKFHCIIYFFPIKQSVSFKKIKRNKGFIFTYPNIYHFQCTDFLPVGLNFHLVL